MKTNVTTIIALFIILSACTKSGIDLTPPGIPSSPNPSTPQGRPTSFFKIDAAINNFQGTNAKISERNDMISLPVNKSVVISIDEFFGKVKDVKWKLNGSDIASGNQTDLSIPQKGVHKLGVEFKEVESGKNHSKEIKLYAFQQKYLSVIIKPKTEICGKVAIGVTQTLGGYHNEKIGPSYYKESVQQICSGTSARYARIPVSVYDDRTTFAIDLIEPQEVKSDGGFKFCLIFFCLGMNGGTYITAKQVYQTDTFNNSLTANVSNGTYTSGNTTLTID